ncbi:GDSL-type esterase/lipase family protein [Dyadobacter sp. NIV53]|uniref:GDSL-type esterase/lipase family protein n=1 Tax=Dyadobacter sp. NIV53 TaxID=2861765 RepID=UPI001C875C89|nr:GDSL-type esterase/lipase family protein [Dyadobacter sp. NIV53]
MITRYIFILFFLISSHLPAQSVNPTSVKPNIFTLGDSNGTYPHSWPQQLASAIPGAQVFNISKSGRTIGFLNLGDSTLNSLFVIDQNLKKAAEFTGERPYDFVILELGTNDAKNVFAALQHEVSLNLEKLVTKIKNSPYPVISKAKIIIISPPPYGSKALGTDKYAGGDDRVKQMSTEFEKVAHRNGCIFINGYKTIGHHIETMTTDGLHLDSAGSRALIEPILNIIY